MALNNSRFHSYLHDPIYDRLLGMRGILPMNLYEVYDNACSDFVDGINAVSYLYKRPPLQNKFIMDFIPQKKKRIQKVMLFNVDRRFNTLNVSRLNNLCLSRKVFISVNIQHKSIYHHFNKFKIS